jgi:hypothetical protein
LFCYDYFKTCFENVKRSASINQNLVREKKLVLAERTNTYKNRPISKQYSKCRYVSERNGQFGQGMGKQKSSRVIQKEIGVVDRGLEGKRWWISGAGSVYW